MKKDGTAGKGRALLRHLAVVLVFVLAAALVFTPIWVLGGRYAVSAVHDEIGRASCRERVYVLV